MSDDINTSMQRERLSEAAAKSEQNDTPKWTPKVGDWFILKASYCHGDNAGCTEAAPCERCLKACNRFVIGGMHHLTDGDAFFFAPMFCNRDGGCYMDSTHCSVLTDNEKVLKEHAPYSARISEAMPIPSPDLAAAKAEILKLVEDLAVATSQIENHDATLEQQRLCHESRCAKLIAENAELRKRPTINWEKVAEDVKPFELPRRVWLAIMDAVNNSLAAFLDEKIRQFIYDESRGESP